MLAFIENQNWFINECARKKEKNKIPQSQSGTVRCRRTYVLNKDMVLYSYEYIYREKYISRSCDINFTRLGIEEKDRLRMPFVSKPLLAECPFTRPIMINLAHQIKERVNFL